MVYVHFPQQYTEEEEALQKKYQKLKRKKKALQQLKAPKPEPPPLPNPLKSSSEAKQDAKEVAKKLLKSGAIHAIKVENKERQGFKRPQASLERRRSGPDKPVLTGYHPFTASHPEPEYTEPAPNTSSASNRTTAKHLYDSFISSKQFDEGEREGPPPKREKPRQGNTVYVHGRGVTEEILKNAFGPIGKILNITMEMKKNCGFVTFESMECADKAIAEINGCLLSGIQVNVSLARNQPSIASPNWNNNANKKDGHKEKRTLVIYDDDVF